MSTPNDLIAQALGGAGPLHQAMLRDRARELAQVAEAPIPAADGMPVLAMTSAGGRWSLPLAAVARIEPLAACVSVPGQPEAVLGLALLAGRRRLVVDPDAFMLASARRSPSRKGHAVLLRQYPLALAVDRADAIQRVADPQPGRRLLADGSRLIDADRLWRDLSQAQGARQ
ncbi:MAG TPA: chemotaxis protein CheW [Magnetospirillum sp.]|nr:chemotaxis protein CheW [Magnetospirillum sp.]